ncbi:MAG: hypothetical protein K2F77_01760 [Muribaculaceae bacterium]|nr:hypothetical protein [Muribaculaceae bacterium]
MKYLLIAACLPLCACGNGLNNPSSSAALDSAAAHGRADAAILGDSTSSIMERERAIFNIRHKEAHMRAMGYDKAADAYIEAAETVIPDSISEK